MNKIYRKACKTNTISSLPLHNSPAILAVLTMECKIRTFGGLYPNLNVGAHGAPSHLDLVDAPSTFLPHTIFKTYSVDI